MVAIQSISEVGGHAVNEDAFAVELHPDNPDCVVCCLADGQGGQHGGATASHLACRTAFELACGQASQLLVTSGAWAAILTKSDEAVAAAPDAGFTTLIAFCIFGDLLVGASNGDSAVFAFVQGRLLDMTKGRMKNPPVGFGSAYFVPFEIVLVRPWKVLAVSDGVWKYIPREDFAQIVSGNRGERLIEALQKKGRLRGSGCFQDDFTVVLIENTQETTSPDE